MRLALRLGAVALLWISTSASAATIVVPLSVDFDTGATGSFATLTITEDAGDLDFVVSLAGTSLGLMADLHEFYFNLVGSPTGVSILTDNAPNVPYTLIVAPAVLGGAGSSFEYGVNFGNGGGPAGNTVLKLAAFTISANQPLTLASLEQLSTTRAGISAHFALHVQGTGDDAEGSETVGGVIVPEPALGLLLAAAAGALARRRR